ncbi:translation initiation factor IF-3 [Patescibacteria group bacterium]|nr:translation initiation factor IF-3 [Patescibacteria group bacterium]MCH8889125.1 translation initiation factor IF-3 [Patescibacteria group bacterium]
MKETVAINQYIRAQELRVIGQDDANLGVISRDDALKIAEEAGLDLIEISPKAVPPVAKIMDYGKFQYSQQKKQREIKAKSHITKTKTKTIQIKVGTGSHDLNLKAKRISEWLQEGHRVRVDLFLRGRYKYMDEKFLKSHIEGFLKLVTEDYKIADVIKKSPKGFSATIERGKKS